MNEKNKPDIRKLTLAALFIALNVVCTRFVFFMFPGNVLRISLQFLPDALCGMILGPVYALVSCATADIFGMLLNSGGMAYYPGFTVGAAVQGLLFGILLYRGKNSLGRCFAAAAVVTLAVDLVLTPIWVRNLTGADWAAIFSLRLPVHAVYMPVKAALIYGTSKLLYRANISGITK